MSHANLDKSCELASQLPFERKYPFRNAFEAVQVLSDRAYYVEGFAVHAIAVMEHGWVELNGEILEPTTVWREHADVEYFTGLRYRRSTIIRLIEKYGALPLAWMDRRFGDGDPRYRRARKEAFSYLKYRSSNGSNDSPTGFLSDPPLIGL